MGGSSYNRLAASLSCSTVSRSALSGPYAVLRSTSAGRTDISPPLVLTSAHLGRSCRRPSGSWSSSSFSRHQPFLHRSAVATSGPAKRVSLLDRQPRQRLAPLSRIWERSLRATLQLPGGAFPGQGRLERPREIHQKPACSPMFPPE